MVTNSFGNRFFMQPMGRLSMHSWWALVFSLGGGRRSCFLFFFLVQSLPPAISLGQKWWPTVLEIKNTCSQLVGWSMHSRCLEFFSFKFWVEGVGEVFFHFTFVSQHVPSMLPSSSQWVPIRFPMCSQCVPNVFPKGLPNSTSLYPIYFAQSPPLLTYIGGPKGEVLQL
jgi:hypothetical protein